MYQKTEALTIKLCCHEVDLHLAFNIAFFCSNECQFIGVCVLIRANTE